MEIQKSIPLTVDDSDLDEARKREVEEHLRATQVLGEQEQVSRAILDMLPTVIAERIQKVIPRDFELSELELRFDVQGKLFGAGVGGEVVAKLKRKS